MALQQRRPLRLDDQLCFALYAATSAITGAYRPVLGALDLTFPQYLVLLVLWQDGSRRVGRIATRLRLAPDLVSSLVDQLETAGIVRRASQPADPREAQVALTDAGIILERAAAHAQESVACRTGLSDAELAALRDELHELVGRMTTGGDGAA